MLWWLCSWALRARRAFTTPAAAEPPPAEIERQPDPVWEKLEPVIEQYNKIHSELLTDGRRSAALQKRIAPLQPH